jgi:hypothetical protein
MVLKVTQSKRIKPMVKKKVAANSVEAYKDSPIKKKKRR